MIIRIILLVFLLQTSFAVNEVKMSDHLLLTPYIKSGQIEEGRNLAKVGEFSQDPELNGRESYSGFITVNELFNSNLFFWFYPAINNPDEAPVVLWLDGGPGVTVFITQFNQHGPLQVSSDGKSVGKRDITWTDDFSVIYLESPVGTGYSFTENESGYSKSSLEAGQNTLEFLRQFFKLFPQFQPNPFYIGGISYGGHFAPPVALLVDENNQKEGEIEMNLKGLLLLSPWSDPKIQMEPFSSIIYNTGLIDLSQKTEFDSKHLEMVELINQGKFAEAKDLLHSVINNPGSLFMKYSGYTVAMSILEDKTDMSGFGFLNWVIEPDVRSAIHVGSLDYDFVNKTAQTFFSDDFMTSVKPEIEQILTKGYKVFLVGGQMDLSVPHLGVEKLANALEWSKKVDFSTVERKIWKINEDLAGWTKSYENLSYICLRNAGHMLVADQKLWNLEIVKKLTKGIKF